jgi:S1-C subfamily serine protease
LLGRDDRQEVTGLTVNRFVNVNRPYIRSIRGALHAWRKFDETGAEAQFKAKYNFSGSNSFRHSVYGRIQHVGAIRGWDDEVYIKLRNEFNDVSSHLKIPTKVLTWEEKAAKAVWVIEDHKEIHQGTAVFIEGFGLVTCAHCVGSDPYIYHPTSPSKKYPVVAVARHNTVDLAVLKLAPGASPDFTQLPPQAFQSTLRRGDAIKLFGYPQHAPGKDLSEKEGKIQSFTMKSGIRRFNISAAVVTGNSGGPVINRYRRVAGIAVTGTDDPSGGLAVEEHGVIPIGALQHVIHQLDSPPPPTSIGPKKRSSPIADIFNYFGGLLRLVWRR